MFLKLCLLTSYLFWSSLPLAWAQDDHLVPTNSYFFSYAHEDSYYPKVREILYEGLPTTPLARVVILPSFTPEYMLSLEQEKKQYYLIYRTCQPSIWSTLQQNWAVPQPKTGKHPTVETKKLAVGPALATAVATLFNAAIAQTKYPEPRMTSRSDGTTFVFSSFRAGIGLQGGQMWSPPVGTHMSALEAVVNQLQKLAVATDADRQPLLTSITEQATKLTILLNTP